MSPQIRYGDLVTQAPLAQRLPRLGNVLAFISPVTNKLMVHRVLAVRKSQLLLKADNGTRPDGWVDPKGILGCVVQVDHQHQPCRIGLGPERVLIGILSRLNLLQPDEVLFRRQNEPKPTSPGGLRRLKPLETERDQRVYYKCRRR